MLKLKRLFLFVVDEIPKKECTQYKCSDTFGHFDYRSFYKAYPRQQQQFKMLQSEKPTTIVVHIKNIKVCF